MVLHLRRVKFCAFSALASNCGGQSITLGLQPNGRFGSRISVLESNVPGQGESDDEAPQTIIPALLATLLELGSNGP